MARSRDPDLVILETAARQHGVVSRRQLLQAGVSRRALEYRLERGRIQLLHRGVYRVGPVSGRFGREKAALLACGRDSVLSHGSAAAVWEIVPAPPAEWPVEVTGPRGLQGPGTGVRLHRVHRLPPDERAHRYHLELTSPARTLLDLAPGSAPSTLERALARAIRQELVTVDELAEVLARHPRCPGRVLLQGVLTATADPALTRSEAEARFLALVDRGGLPRPRANVLLRGVEVDFLWRGAGLVVEVDGFVYHRGRAAFERDRDRDAVLLAAGLRVLRVTWRQLVREPEKVLVRLAQALGAPR